MTTVDTLYQAESKPPTFRAGWRLAGAADVWRANASLGSEMREHFVLMSLDVRHKLIQRHVIAIGSLCGVEVHPREVFRAAILDHAAAIIIVHNHPSGDTGPSRQDIELTARLRECGELLGIPILDHVIIAGDGYTSLAERNWR